MASSLCDVLQRRKEVCPVYLYPYLTRTGSIGLWPIKQPNADSDQSTSAMSQERAALDAMDHWVKIKWGSSIWNAKKGDRTKLPRRT